MIAGAATIVDWHALGNVVLYSVVASVGISVAFGLAIRGTMRFADLRRTGHAAGAAVYALLAVTALAISLAAVAYGIYLMTQK